MTRPTALLLLGLLTGIGAAAYSLIAGEATLPDGAAARVNHKLIAHDAWQRAVAAVESERRTPLTDADRRAILDRLIDEELLVQHGLALGLIEQDRRLRGQLVSEVMAAAMQGAAQDADEAALRRYYEQHRDYFSAPGRLRVAALFVRVTPQRLLPAALERAQIAAQRLRGGEPFGAVAGDLGDEVIPPLPDALLPAAKLRAYLGPRMTEATLTLSAGETSAPLQTDSGVMVLHLLESEPGATPPFEEVREQVRQAVRREADETAVRALLARLRKQGRVAVREQLDD
jgi:hypothetical protein